MQRPSITLISNRFFSFVRVTSSISAGLACRFLKIGRLSTSSSAQKPSARILRPISTALCRKTNASALDIWKARCPPPGTKGLATGLAWATVAKPMPAPTPADGCCGLWLFRRPRLRLRLPPATKLLASGLAWAAVAEPMPVDDCCGLRLLRWPRLRLRLRLRALLRLLSPFGVRLLLFLRLRLLLLLRLRLRLRFLRLLLRLGFLGLGLRLLLFSRVPPRAVGDFLVATFLLLLLLVLRLWLLLLPFSRFPP
mmetsp:Transcript_109256/g.308209  ORF Transcript_109256/g.308209 Transcript_109256/m.308209 type:complete len:253 (+) Transcript_109256:464-1222(+)